MTPIQLLKKELKTYEKALRKSIDSYDRKQIDFNLHSKHVSNLNPIIFKYKEAIQKLTS